MQGPAIGLLGFAAVVLLIVLRVPVGIAMGVVGAIGYGFVYGFATLGFVLGRAPFDAVFPVSLSVVPLFVMMGVFAGHAGLSKSLYALVASFIGHFRGGLAMATIGASALFGAVCGSSIATAATIGRIALPEMRAHRYQDRLAAASVAAGGTLGVMIPPSIMFVIYGLMTENPIGRLFVAGILPGLLGMLLYMGAVAFLTRRHPEIGPAAERQTWAERLQGLKEVWQVVLLFGVVLAVSRKPVRRSCRVSLPPRAARSSAPNAPTAAASVGENQPRYMPPSTTPKRSTTCHTSFSPCKRSAQVWRSAAGPISWCFPPPHTASRRTRRCCSSPTRRSATWNTARPCCSPPRRPTAATSA